jgi:ribonuclease HI
MAEFACQECGKVPGRTPRFCKSHRASAKAKPTSGTPAKAPSDAAPAVQRLPPGNAAGSKTFRSSGGSTVDLSPDEVLARYTSGPTTGVFTDGGARPNPGPGGWGFVYVEDGKIMAALEHLPTDARVTIFSDSDLCVKTLTIWAKSWAAKGWRRKEGEIKNLDLVQRAYELARAHPGVKLQWIKAHDGSRWNEYVDALATRALKHL